MQLKNYRSNKLKSSLTSIMALSAMLQYVTVPVAAQAQSTGASTPIQHVIVIIGENRTFDHIFATYVAKHPSEGVLNLLSQGFINADGTPGPRYYKTAQYTATDTDSYHIHPLGQTQYTTLPPAYVGGPSTPYLCQLFGVTSGTSCSGQEFLDVARLLENGLDDNYYQYLLTGGTGQSGKVPDARISYAGANASNLPSGPYQLTNPNYPYDSYGPSPVHRFFQMWQELDCSLDQISSANGWGCDQDLFAWVERTVGAGSDGAAESANYLGEGSTALGFYNVQQGDAPYLKSLADTYSMSDNYHQAVNGGTGANHIMLGTGDAIFFSDENGRPATPPNNNVDPNNPGTILSGQTSALSEIENPNPQPGANNYYIQDGYGGGSGAPGATSPNANYGGGSYVGCWNTNHPGVGSIVSYLQALPNPVDPNCVQNAYYLVNNYNPGYFGDGSNAYTDTNPNNTVFTIPPSKVPNIGDVLNEAGVSWAYYGDQFAQYLADKYQLNYNIGIDEYCNICNWAQYSTSIMTDPAQRAAHLQDTEDFYLGILTGSLPAVSYVKPSGWVDGHPASSKLILFEGYVKKIVDLVKASPLWASTAIFITFDEGGGYWDSGYVQPLDFFGDGTRIPLIVVSPYSTGGHISHTYADHVSIAKFIEANWGLPPISDRSRDNLPNPIVGSNPYVPTNSPAIGDLTDLFNFN
ncbi:MAG TPA: alkaline phosphatase family protein [Methylocystis sp.]|nr:alkaline phosphatase family protein [Methylocystis sp.]